MFTWMEIPKGMISSAPADGCALYASIFEHGNRYGLVMFELPLRLTRISPEDYIVLFMAFVPDRNTWYGVFYGINYGGRAIFWVPGMASNGSRHRPSKFNVLTVRSIVSHFKLPEDEELTYVCTKICNTLTSCLMVNYEFWEKEFGGNAQTLERCFVQ